MLPLILFFSLLPTGPQGASRSSYPPLAYTAEFSLQEARGVTRGTIQYDRGRFRVGILFPRTKVSEPVYYEMCDRSEPPVVWAYFAESRRAQPTLDCLIGRFSALARALGMAEARRRFHAPEGASDALLAAGPRTVAVPYHFHESQLLARRERSSGTELVSGRSCRLVMAYDGPIEVRAGPQAGGATGAAGVRRSQKAWVDEITGLVLKLEERTEYDSPVPPERSVFELKRVRFVKNIPTPAFQLPPGSTAILYEPFAGLRLPRGVRSERKAGIGISVGTPLHKVSPAGVRR